MSHEPSWWIVIIAAVLTLATGVGAWYLVAFTSADAEWLKSAFLLGFGGIIGLATPTAVGLARSARARAPEPEDEALAAHKARQFAEADQAMSDAWKDRMAWEENKRSS